MKYIVSVAVLLVGVFLIVRGITAQKSPTRIDRGVEVPQAVRDALDPAGLEHSIDDAGVESTLELVHQRVVEVSSGMSALGGTDRVNDLADVFCEQLIKLWEPDFERDFAASSARFDPLSRERALEMHKQINANPQMSSMGRVSIERLSVRVCNPSTEYQFERDLFAKGFSLMVGERLPDEQFPVPSDDPIQSGALVAEVKMPMLRKDMLSQSPKPAIAGFRFVYHPAKGCWMPYQSVVHASQEVAFTMVPF